jgi:hypothetical protein
MDPAHVREDWRTCFTEEERQAIRQQLERMLANPLFKYSKRYPNLLRFVVESTLEGRTEELKERSLGVAVFAREPDYDTNLDPVVRTTAGVAAIIYPGIRDAWPRPVHRRTGPRSGSEHQASCGTSMAVASDRGVGRAVGCVRLLARALGKAKRSRPFLEAGPRFLKYRPAVHGAARVSRIVT